jgi:signal transduction histidine kinase/ligand-binding sensor domain-containing protein
MGDANRGGKFPRSCLCSEPILKSTLKLTRVAFRGTLATMKTSAEAADGPANQILTRPALRCLAVAVLLLGGVCSPAAIAQNADGGVGDYVARFWQWEDGLPANTVLSVVQTPDGFLWVTTAGGLARFDGLSFQAFLARNILGHASRYVRAQFVDHRGCWWLAFDRAFVGFEDPDSVRSYTVGELLGIPTGIAEDRAGRVWFGYQDGRLVCISDGKVRILKPQLRASGDVGLHIASDSEGKLWLGQDRTVGIVEDESAREVVTLREPIQQICTSRSGGIWVCTKQRITRVWEGASAHEEMIEVAHGLASRVTALREDCRGVLWIGTADKGLWRFEGQRLIRTTTSHEAISCLAEDAEGNLWVGTLGGGLNRLRPRTVEVMPIDDKSPTSPVKSVTEDVSGRLWVVMGSGELLKREGHSWQFVSAQPDWPGGKVNCVTADAGGALWIGTEKSGLWRLRDGELQSWRASNGLADDSVRTMLLGGGGDLWLGFSTAKQVQRLREGVFQTFLLPESARMIRALAEDAAGAIWVATSDGQLLYASGDELVGESGVPVEGEYSIRCLLATADGSLYIGYAGSGIGRLKAGRFSAITTADGLHDGYVSQMVADDRGWLWCAGRRGLFHLDSQNLDAVADGRQDRIHSFLLHSRTEGVGSLQAVAYSGTGATRGRDGSLYFPMQTGLAVVRPKGLRAVTDAPRSLLEYVVVDGKTVALYASRSPLHPTGSQNLMNLRGGIGKLELLPWHRKIEFGFAAPSFTATENVYCRYQLQGFDEEWVEADTRRSASYPRLPAGDYQFHVTACNEAGIWEPAGTSLALTVRPFLWNTWWFQISVALALLSGVLLVARHVSQRRLREQVRQVQQRAALDRERARIARDMHDTLGASLTQINLLGELASHESTGRTQSFEYVRKMTHTSHSLVQQLDEIVWAVDPGNDTLDDLATYVSQFATEFLADLPIRFRMKVPPILPRLRLNTEARHNLFLAVREAFNNVVRHAAATEVSVTLGVQGKTLSIVIEDNGCGFQVAAPTARHGLANLTRRLHEIGGTCRIESEPGHGTKITLLWQIREHQPPFGGAVEASAKAPGRTEA